MSPDHEGVDERNPEFRWADDSGEDHEIRVFGAPATWSGKT
jgi:hypothetical protein